MMGKPASHRPRTAKSRGQAMTEYIIIVALIAIGAIAVVTVFGNNIRALFGTSANALTGNPDTMQTDNAPATAKTLEDFGEYDTP